MGTDFHSTGSQSLVLPVPPRPEGKSRRPKERIPEGGGIYCFGFISQASSTFEDDLSHPNMCVSLNTGACLYTCSHARMSKDVKIRVGC